MSNRPYSRLLARSPLPPCLAAAPPCHRSSSMHAMPSLLPSTCKAEAVVPPVSLAKELGARKNGGVDCLTRRQNQRLEPPDTDLRLAAMKKQPPFGAPNAGTSIGTGVGQPREEGGRHHGKRRRCCHRGEEPASQVPT